MSGTAPTGAATPTGACPYGLCDGSGFVVDEATNTASDCRCRPARISAARARALEGRIPKKYADVAIDRWPVTQMDPSIVGEVRQYIHAIEKNLEAGKGLFFIGDPGTGKTTLAMIVSKAAIAARRSTAIYSQPRLMNILREAGDSEGGRLALLDKLTSVDLLHIDDLGVSRTDWMVEQLYSIVNTRYEDQRSLIVTTNLSKPELDEQVGYRTMSRIAEMCGDPLPLFGADERLPHSA